MSPGNPPAERASRSRAGRLGSSLSPFELADSRAATLALGAPVRYGSSSEGMPSTISFRLNDKPIRLQVDGGRKLIWVLRTELELTGTKPSCARGLCGACTVLVNDRPVRSCITPVHEVSGKKVVTIEGLAGRDGELHPLQKAFVEHDALQCGFCTPGMILTAYGLIHDKRGKLSREEIVRGMDRNLCRCGAHTRIIAAIESAAKEMA